MYPNIKSKPYTSSYIVNVSKDCFIKCHNWGTAQYFYRLAKRGDDVSIYCEPVKNKSVKYGVGRRGHI